MKTKKHANLSKLLKHLDDQINLHRGKIMMRPVKKIRQKALDLEAMLWYGRKLPALLKSLTPKQRKEVVAHMKLLEKKHGKTEIQSHFKSQFNWGKTANSSQCHGTTLEPNVANSPQTSASLNQRLAASLFNQQPKENHMNQITISVSELKSALPGLGKVIGKRSSLPVLDTIRLTRNGQGNVSLQATDLDSHAIYHCTEAQPGAPIDMLVPFEPLNKLVKGLGNTECLNIIQESKKALKIKYPLGGSIMEQKLESLPANEFPPLPNITAQDIQVGPEFGPALKQAFQCCSSDTSRPIICGAYVDVEDKNLHYIVGTNGRVLFSANSFAFDLKKSVIIPDTKFLNWTDMMDNGCKLTHEPAKSGSGYIQLKSDRWTFIAREIEGKYPNWKQCLPAMDGKKTVIQLSPQAVNQILEVLPHLPGNEDVNRVVRLSFVSGNLKIEGRS